MVPVETFYQIRNLLLIHATEDSENDDLKKAFLVYLDLQKSTLSHQNDKAYLRCTLAGLKQGDCKPDDLTRVLGQSPYLDGTPMPWVSDIWPVFGIKLAALSTNDQDIISQFNDWINKFLPERIQDSRIPEEEKSLAKYILNGTITTEDSSCIKLFLHYKGICPLEEMFFQETVDAFMKKFKDSYKKEACLSAITKALYVFVFDRINSELASVPPKRWTKDDIIAFLENLQAGLKKWTWEDKAKTKGASPVKWPIENEYHVQNLLYVMLASIFPDIQDEVYTDPIGQKTARIDLRLPSIKTIIEVKYRKNQKKSFQDLIGEVAEDRSLYRSDERFKDNTLICFLWDNTMSTQEHDKFKEGISKIEGIDGCVVISAPSTMASTS